MADAIAKDALGDKKLDIRVMEREPKSLEKASKIAERMELYARKVKPEGKGGIESKIKDLVEPDVENMEYGTYFLSVLIIGAVVLGVIIVKLLTILCNVMRHRCRMLSWRSDIITGSDISQYQGEQYTQRSAISHFEETPQPIFCVTPGSSEACLPPFMTPPPYHIAIIKDEKPPPYEEAINHGVDVG